MHEQFANAFYRSRIWRKTRDAYLKKRGGLCECCLAKGIYTPGAQVHHKIRLTPENLNKPEITLNEENLELLCQECHAAKHGARRWAVNPDGTIRLRSIPPH